MTTIAEAQRIEHLAAELDHLEANHAEMPAQELQHRRGTALEIARAVLNRIAEADKFDRPAYDRVYDLVLRLDRVGY